MRAISLLAAGLLLGACAPELGECDPVAATQVTFGDASGEPAYEGQALMIGSCGNGNFCHGAETSGLDDRFGVPAGLDFDVRLAGDDGAVDEAEILRLRRSRFRVVQEAHPVYASVALGSMPPRGGGAEDVWDSRPTYSTSEGVALPAVDTPEGQDVLRNWLACGAPVIERTLPRDDGVRSVHFPSIVRTPVEPNWPSIYEDLLLARGCAAVRCHGGGDAAAGFVVDDGDAAQTYDRLVGVQASGGDADASGCGGMGVLVVANQPEESLLIQKLRAQDDSEVCGLPMPRNGHIREDDIAAIEQWIAAGALRE